MVWPIKRKIKYRHGGMVCTKVWKRPKSQVRHIGKVAELSAEADKEFRDFADMDILKVGEWDLQYAPKSLKLRHEDRNFKKASRRVSETRRMINTSVYIYVLED